MYRQKTNFSRELLALFFNNLYFYINDLKIPAFCRYYLITLNFICMKKNFFKTAILSLVLACGVNIANAQMGQMPSPDEMAKMQADQMKQTVNLNDDQYNKVLVVYKESGEKMRKMFEGGGQPDFSKFGEIQEDQNKKFKEILTDEQYKKWDEYQQQMRQNMGGGFGGGF